MKLRMIGEQPVVLVVMGVAGTGKSKVAATLAERLGWDLGEGDDLHPAANVAKMANGQPLTDEDRWPWLDKVAQWIVDHAGRRPTGHHDLFGAQEGLSGQTPWSGRRICPSHWKSGFACRASRRAT